MLRRVTLGIEKVFEIATPFVLLWTGGAHCASSFRYQVCPCGPLWDEDLLSGGGTAAPTGALPAPKARISALLRQWWYTPGVVFARLPWNLWPFLQTTAEVGHC